MSCRSVCTAGRPTVDTCHAWMSHFCVTLLFLELLFLELLFLELLFLERLFLELLFLELLFPELLFLELVFLELLLESPPGRAETWYLSHSRRVSYQLGNSPAVPNVLLDKLP